MSFISRQLITYLNQPDEAQDFSVVTSYVNAVLFCGTNQDAEFLLTHFISRPIDNSSLALLPIFAKWGDEVVARKIYETHLKGKPTTIENHPELLKLLGEMQFSQIKPLLIKHTFESEDYYLQKHAVLGLLHFNCDNIKSKIRDEIEKTYGQNLFAEFIPALVCKLQNRSEILEKLWESGCQYCSTDCNAGIILGFSLCGKEGGAYFKKVLYDPRWETDSTATSTAYYTYMGTINQRMSLIQFFNELLTIHDKEKQEQGLQVLLTMLHFRIGDYTNECPDLIVDLYSQLFNCQNGTDITELANQYQLEDEAYVLQDLLKIKMTEKAILSNYHL